MAATGTRSHNGSSAQRGTAQGNYTESKLVDGLGWFSIGLGLAEIVIPSAVSALIGVENDKKTRGVLRGYGVREMAAGIGILTRQRPTKWLWGRVAGDVVDISSLASAFASERNDRTRLTAATAAVVGVTALDVICANRLSAQERRNGGGKESTKAVKSIVVDSSPQRAYSFWRDFDNLPRFMTYLEAVQSTGDRRSHWTVNGPGGIKVEWDAELVRDEPNRLIAWKSVRGKFANEGTVKFEQAPGGRGTLVRVEMDYAPNGGPLNSSLGKILGTDIGQRIMHDLRNFKQILEIGEVTQSDASIHSGMHAAQPPEEQAA